MDFEELMEKLQSLYYTSKYSSIVSTRRRVYITSIVTTPKQRGGTRQNSAIGHNNRLKK